MRDVFTWTNKLLSGLVSKEDRQISAHPDTCTFSACARIRQMQRTSFMYDLTTLHAFLTNERSYFNNAKPQDINLPVIKSSCCFYPNSSKFIYLRVIRRLNLNPQMVRLPVDISSSPFARLHLYHPNTSGLSAQYPSQAPNNSRQNVRHQS